MHTFTQSVSGIHLSNNLKYMQHSRNLKEDQREKEKTPKYPKTL